MHELLEARRASSRGRLADLVKETEVLEAIRDDEPLCIYITGSYGRLEAASDSDLDLFFLFGEDDPEAEFSRAKWLELAGRLIEVVRTLKFPDFSGDAEYLEIHNVAKMGRDLGSRVDDSENRFTARMLLLLESRPILNADLYETLIEQVVGFYFEDFTAHEADFRPTYLINDILRFWRTLCLNYENKRTERRRDFENGDLDETTFRSKSAIDNVKLRFSRLTTCHSMVAALAAQTPPVTADQVVRLAQLTPTERWESLSGGNETLVGRLLDLYEGFLALTQDKASLMEKMSSHEGREAARQSAAEYGELVAQLLEKTAHSGQHRYLLI